jgi:riboflavin kinase/FMN adenylyltransferase
LEQKRVLALGFFDGVHLGHGALLKAARQAADRLGCPAAVLTFDRHPGELVSGTRIPLLNTADDRAGLMKRLYGMDEVLFGHFDRAMMEMPWKSYVGEYLVQTLGAVHVVCGHDHHFGWRGEGNPTRLRQACSQFGIGCDVVQKVTLHGTTVSSTYVRKLLEAGQMDEAVEFLGHPHVLSGTVVRGRQLGRQLGTPTANLLLPEGILSPAFGVYACQVVIGGRKYPAVTNVGVRPTVNGGDQITVEPWILDFEGNLYDKEIRVEFWKFLRPERKFSSLEELQAAIFRNAEETRTFFARS